MDIRARALNLLIISINVISELIAKTCETVCKLTLDDKKDFVSMQPCSYELKRQFLYNLNYTYKEEYMHV